MHRHIESRKRFKNLPNQLSLFRIAVVPFILLIYPLDYHPLRMFAALLFTLAAISDWLDGYIARKYQLESRLGAVLDPIADKMLTGSALILLAGTHAVWPWLAGFLLARELGMSGLRLVAQEQGITIKVNTFGKVKTLVMDVALVCLMVNYPLFGWPFREVGMISIWLAVVLSFYSAWLYIREFMEQAHF
jgi:CDP-diacylglycerol--glycerol-3-phosphate 3-phosphatidyltransferase